MSRRAMLKSILKEKKEEVKIAKQMSKAFASGKITGEVVVCTKNLDPNVLIILPANETRSLVVNDINLSNIRGSGINGLYEFKPPAIGSIVTVTYDPVFLYKSGGKVIDGWPGKNPSFFNWMIDAVKLDSIRETPELRQVKRSLPKRKPLAINEKKLDEVYALARKSRTFMLRHFRKSTPRSDLDRRLLAKEREKPLWKYVSDYGAVCNAVKRLSEPQHTLIVQEIRKREVSCVL